MDTNLAKIVPCGTAESEWSKPVCFERYDGYGDASGWTGTAARAAAARYRTTGTAADYERVLTKLEKAVFLYEVTNVPGLIARSHGGTGMDRQWPRLGMTTPCWVGRMDGVITEGEGLALGWRELDGPCP
jgi:hypothetical protein